MTDEAALRKSGLLDDFRRTAAKIITDLALEQAGNWADRHVSLSFGEKAADRAEAFGEKAADRVEAAYRLAVENLLKAASERYLKDACEAQEKSRLKLDVATKTIRSLEKRLDAAVIRNAELRDLVVALVCKCKRTLGLKTPDDVVVPLEVNVL